MRYFQVHTETRSDDDYCLPTLKMSLWVLGLLLLLVPVGFQGAFTAAEYADKVANVFTKGPLSIIIDSFYGDNVSEDIAFSDIPAIDVGIFLIALIGLYWILWAILFLAAWEPTFWRRWIAFVGALSVIFAIGFPTNSYLLFFAIIAGYPTLLPIFLTIPYDDSDYFPDYFG